jgi:malate synthase
MKKKYTKIKNLSVSLELANFINKELLPGTGIIKDKFWYGLDKYAHELAPKNKNLLEFREILQKKLTFGIEIKREKKLILKNIQIF